ncbi:MAG TPA: hypothetical protein VFI73_00745 [Candidatus Nitrosopolaris sp.]|nr:hypothetical protein [Candidatus Nitrosopolaris sp.]
MSGNISSSSGLLKKFKGATDNNGIASYSLYVGGGAQMYTSDYETKLSSIVKLLVQVVLTIIPPSSNDAPNNNKNNNASNAAHDIIFQT